jgi:hypothetical protein
MHRRSHGIGDPYGRPSGGPLDARVLPSDLFQDADESFGAAGLEISEAETSVVRRRPTVRELGQAKVVEHKVEPTLE